MLTRRGVRLLARGAGEAEAGYRRIAKLYGERRLKSLFKLLAALEKVLEQDRRRG
jgi:hypothetical protein